MESITVSLAEGSATVSYDPSVTDPQTIAGEDIVMWSVLRCHLLPGPTAIITPPGVRLMCCKCVSVTLCLCFARPGQ